MPGEVKLVDSSVEDLVELAAEEKGVDRRNICVVCLEAIQIMSFKGTGVCGEIHRKIRDGEATAP